MEPGNNRIVVVEDDPHILLGLEDILSQEGFEVSSSSRGDDAMETIENTQPALVILDVMLPGQSGYDICRELRRKNSSMPVLMLTAKSQEIDKVVGLELGADDYVTKPFGVKELVARVRALLRRATEIDRAREKEKEKASLAQAAEEMKTFLIGKSLVNEGSYCMEGKGSEVNLTPREMDLIRYLSKHRGVVLGRERLLQEVWGVNYFGTTRTLDQTVAQLRKKLKQTGTDPEVIATVHGVGYRVLD